MTSPEEGREQDVQRIEMEIGFGERTWSFHRDPSMPMHEGGQIFIDWATGESPDVSFYTVETRGRVGWGLNEMSLLDELNLRWKSGKIDTPKINRRGVKLVQRWSHELDARTGTLDIPGKGPNSEPYILAIKARPIEILQ